MMLTELPIDYSRIRTAAINSLAAGRFFVSSAGISRLSCQIMNDGGELAASVPFQGIHAFHILPTQRERGYALVFAELTPNLPVTRHALQILARSVPEEGGNMDGHPQGGWLVATPEGICLWASLQNVGYKLIRLADGLEANTPDASECFWIRSWEMSIHYPGTNAKREVAEFPIPQQQVGG